MLNNSLSVSQSFEIPLLRIQILILIISFADVLSFLYILDISHLSDAGWIKIFIHSANCSFVLLPEGIFCLTEAFSIVRPLY